MRETLQKLYGKRLTVTGTFVRYGYKRAGDGNNILTLLFVNITSRDSGEVYSDHCWLNCNPDLAELGELQPGDRVQFSARIKRYNKGYRGRRRVERLDNPPAIDYRFSHPTNVKRYIDQPAD